MRYMPTWYCENIYSLDLDALNSYNIKYILCDLDNTLAPYNVTIPNKETIELIENIKNHNLNFIIVSNNTGKRVKIYARELKVDFISGAKKPFTSTIKKYLVTNNIDINDCVLIGDQIMTDIKCANKLNCRCILTNPLSKEESIVTFFNRKIDRYYRKKYNLVKECKRIDRSGR